ncbi:MAG: ATP-binding cassette domain-containing protein [Micrococcus sp.]|nr:ATP-binding cassette domain-containing protein [Micrococcus sp.]
MSTPAPSTARATGSRTEATSVPPRVSARDLAVEFGSGHRHLRIEMPVPHLDVTPGMLVVLAGRSGSGKTTLLKMLAGLQPPTSGTVHWNGETVDATHAEATAARRRGFLSYMDQAASLIPTFTVLENIMLAAVPVGKPADYADRAQELLEILGLADRTDQRVPSLSGGERARISLARSLLLETPVLVVDEPTASLDRATADRVIGLLHAHADNGGSVIAASHDPNVLAAATDLHPMRESAPTPEEATP